MACSTFVLLGSQVKQPDLCLGKDATFATATTAAVLRIKEQFAFDMVDLNVY